MGRCIMCQHATPARPRPSTSGGTSAVGLNTLMLASLARMRRPCDKQRATLNELCATPGDTRASAAARSGDPEHRLAPSCSSFLIRCFEAASTGQPRPQVLAQWASCSPAVYRRGARRTACRPAQMLSYGDG